MKTGLAEPPEPNGMLPCGTESARRRHTIRAEECPECGVEGAVPPEVWLERRTPTLRVPETAIHSRYAYVSNRCRCDVCRQAASDYMRNWRAQRLRDFEEG